MNLMVAGYLGIERAAMGWDEGNFGKLRSFVGWREDDFLKTIHILLTRTLACPIIISLLKYNLL